MQSKVLWAYIIGGIILFFALIIGAVFWFLPISEKKNFTEKISQTIESVTIPIITPIKTALENSINTPNTQELEQEIQKEKQKAQIKENISCDEIQNSQEKKSCKETLLLRASMERGSIDGCKNIIDITKKMFCQDEILIAQSKKSKDFSLCENISSPLSKKQCQQESLFAEMNAAKTKEECLKIPDEKISSQCIKKFLTPEDFHFSPLKCNSIDNSEDKTFCQQMTITYALSHDKILHCEYIDGMEEFCFQQQSEYMNRKYFSQAMQEKNIHLCSKIIDTPMRTDCKDGLLPLLAWEKKDVAFCNLISARDQQEQCLEKNITNISVYFMKKAKKENSKSLCEKVLDPERRRKCINIFPSEGENIAEKKE